MRVENPEKILLEVSKIGAYCEKSPVWPENAQKRQKTLKNAYECKRKAVQGLKANRGLREKNI